jgi:hypothetical protein
MVVDACIGGVRIARPAGATLDLNFMSAPLDPRITFTRASTATYTDASGTIRSAAINAPRWDYAGGSLRGLLIEPARMNLCLSSTTANGVGWNVTNGVVAAPGFAWNNAVAPDGTTTATRLDYPAIIGTNAASVYFQAITLTAASYTYSMWLRGAVGGEQIYLCVNPTRLNSGRLTLTTQWQRYSFTFTGTAAGWAFEVGADLADVTQTSTPVQTVYIWGAQVEQGAYRTSLIPTTSAAVTRAVDSTSIAPASMAWFTPPGGSWLAEFISVDPTPAGGGARVIAWPVLGSAAPIYLSSGNQIGQYDGGGGPVTANALTVNTVAKAVTTYTSPTGKNCLNGGAVASGAMSNGYAALATNGVSFMVNSIITDGLSGYLRRVQYWPRGLSDAEMQAVTT